MPGRSTSIRFPRCSILASLSSWQRWAGTRVDGFPTNAQNLKFARGRSEVGIAGCNCAPNGVVLRSP
jgi:hypothetical protein